MDTNNDFGAPNAPPVGGQADANEFSGSGSPQEQRGGSFDFTGAKPGESPDRPIGSIGSTDQKLADVSTTFRDRAGNVKQKLADALQSGADKLRRGAPEPGSLAGAAAGGTTAIEREGRLTQVSDKVAGGMESTADWLRDADIDGLKSGIERQVKEHPGRTLLIAAGLGYLIGRAFRKD